MAKSYEELIGSVGRAVYFRPERRRVREMLSRGAEPTVMIGEQRFRVFDLSLNGLSFTAPAPEAAKLEIGRELELTVLVHNDPLFQGRGRVARKEAGTGSVLVGLALVGGFLDLHEFHRRDEEKRLQEELSGGIDALRKPVPESYRRFLEKAVGWAQYYRQALQRHEERYRPLGMAALDELVGRSLESLRPQWWALENEGSEIARSMMDDPAALRAAKQYTELLLTPLFVKSPMFGRSYEKPRGYPGDFQTMMYCYEDRPEGTTVFDRVFHKLCVEHPLAGGVRTRKDFIIGCIADELERHTQVNGDQVFRATSLGCGPAREIPDFAKTKDGWRGRIHWTLMDQEEEALSLAYQAGSRALASARGSGSLECLHLSFAQFLMDPALFPAKHPQQMIYTVGLFDYLRQRIAQSIIAVLYERLAPGGLLVIGNALSPNNHFWSLEFPTDWTLLYRTQEEMLQLASKIAPTAASVDVQLEPGKAYYFLRIRKR